MTALEHWNLIYNNDHLVPGMRENLVWTTVRDQINAGIRNFEFSEAGTKDAIRWIASLKMPRDTGLGLCDGTEYDRIIAYIIMGMNRLVSSPVIITDGPLAGAMVVVRDSPGASFQYQTGGTNRAQQEEHTRRMLRAREINDLNTVAGCVAAIVALMPHTKAKEWKRSKKVEMYGDTARVFVRRGGAPEQFVTVIHSHDNEPPLEVIDGNLFPPFPMAFQIGLREICRPITHCGDYGMLYWSQHLKQVWLSLGDGDGGWDVDPREMIMTYDGVESVEIAAEEDPKLRDGFVSFGTFGTVVQPTW